MESNLEYNNARSLVLIGETATVFSSQNSVMLFSPRSLDYYDLDIKHVLCQNRY